MYSCGEHINVEMPGTNRLLVVTCMKEEGHTSIREYMEDMFHVAKLPAYTVYNGPSMVEVRWQSS